MQMSEKVDLNDIETLFTLRYMLDDPSDIVNLSQDIADLTSFPERLFGSYQFEWQTYIKREAKKRKQAIDSIDLIELINQLPDSHKTDYLGMLELVRNSQIITNSSNVKVIKSPLKTYIEALLNR